MIIWGQKGYSDHLGYIIFECPACHQVCPFSVFQVRKKFTLYFIPTFSLSNKHYIVCSTCQNALEVPNDKKSELQSMIMSQEELSSLIASIAQERRSQNQSKSIASPSGDYCAKCGVRMRAEDVFCTKCGTRRELEGGFEDALPF